MQKNGRLKQRRIECGMSMEEVARLANISLSQYYKIEAGKHIPRLDTALRIVKALNAKLDIIPPEKTKTFEIKPQNKL